MVKNKFTKGDRIFDAFNTAMMLLVGIIVLYPLIYIISSSFSSTRAVMAGKVWLLPVEFSLDGYKAVFNYSPIWRGYANTLFYAIAGTTLNVTLTILAAYPLSRKDLVGRNIFMLIFTFTMIFNGGIIPTYMVVKNLGILNSRWAMILPNAIAIWNVIITRTYFQQNIPQELLDSAYIDGCSNTRFLAQIVIPVSKAIIAVNILFYAVMHWNAFFNAFIYLNDQKLFPLQVILRKILILNSADMNKRLVVRATDLAAREGLKELLKYSLIVVSSLPVLVLYPMVQKYFVKGVMIGSLKG